MKKILVIGATGQIGSALMTKLRKEYGNDNVVAGYIEGVPLSDELKNGGPLEIADVTNAQQIAAIIDKYKIDSIYNLAAILSARRKASVIGMEYPDRRSTQPSRNIERKRLLALYPQFHRRIRRLVAQNEDSARNHTTAAYHLRSEQGIVRIAE